MRTVAIGKSRSVSRLARWFRRGPWEMLAMILIAGGKGKGGDLGGFVHRIAPRVKHMVLIGATSEEMAFHAAASRVAHTRCGTLAEAVRRAAELAQPGDTVLLSPAFASFDMFRGYADRGEQFEQLVRTLGA